MYHTVGISYHISLITSKMNFNYLFIRLIDLGSEVLVCGISYHKQANMSWYDNKNH